MTRIYEVTAVVNNPGTSLDGTRAVLWTGLNTRRAVALKAMERIVAERSRGGVYSDFRLETRDEESPAL